MIKRIAITLLTLMAVISCQRYGKLDVKANLTRSLAEVSGIALLSSNHTLYAIADHNNPNRIFALDSTGTITQEIVVANAKNEDWEDLTTDGGKRIFIGDFGSNENRRKERVIYAINDIASAKKALDTVTAQKTTFTLADQKKFPPELDNMNFDIEAFIYKDDFFYLFTRNRSRQNFDGTVKVYKVPARAGHFDVKPSMQHQFCTNAYGCAITGASISEDGKTILLLTHEKIFKLTSFSNTNFFDGKIVPIDLNYRSQKEGITYKDKATLYLADERRAQTGGNLYVFDLDQKGQKSN